MFTTFMVVFSILAVLLSAYSLFSILVFLLAWGDGYFDEES